MNLFFTSTVIKHYHQVPIKFCSEINPGYRKTKQMLRTLEFNLINSVPNIFPIKHDTLMNLKMTKLIASNDRAQLV